MKVTQATPPAAISALRSPTSVTHGEHEQYAELVRRQSRAKQHNNTEYGTSQQQQHQRDDEHKPPTPQKSTTAAVSTTLPVAPPPDIAKNADDFLSAFFAPNPSHEPLGVPFTSTLQHATPLEQLNYQIEISLIRAKVREYAAAPSSSEADTSPEIPSVQTAPEPLEPSPPIPPPTVQPTAAVKPLPRTQPAKTPAPASSAPESLDPQQHLTLTRARLQGAHIRVLKNILQAAHEQSNKTSETASASPEEIRIKRAKLQATHIRMLKEALQATAARMPLPPSSPQHALQTYKEQDMIRVLF